ncbi:MAG: SgcJ/EcaC family oxidoreductase [Rubricoccaceae bacterium]
MPSPRLDSPEAMPHAFASAWNARDADALADLFEPNAEFVNVVGLWWHNREAIRKAHAYGLEVIFPDSTLRVIRTREKPLAPDVVLIQAVFRLVGQTAHDSARQPGERRTILSFVMRRGAPGWRCAAAHNTDVVPGAETHIRDADGSLRPTDYRT